MAGVAQFPLPLFHTIAGKPVIVVGDGEAAAAKARLVERAGGIVQDEAAGLAAGARLAFVALEDEALAVAAVERLRAAGVLVNAVDRPGLSDCTVPAVVDRAPVVIAVGTGGASAGLAKALRLRIEALLPARLGGLAAALAAARGAVRGRWPDPAARRRALDAALAEGGALDPFAEHGEAAVAVWLRDGGGPAVMERVEIRLRSDDPDDLTLREARWLGRADWVAYEPGVPVAILHRARADARRVVLAEAGEVPQGDGLGVAIRAGPRKE